MNNKLIRTNLKILSFMLLYVLTIFGVLGTAPVSAATWQDDNWTHKEYRTTGSWAIDNRHQKVNSFKHKFKVKKRLRFKRHSTKRSHLRSHRQKRHYRYHGHNRHYGHNRIYKYYNGRRY